MVWVCESLQEATNEERHVALDLYVSDRDSSSKKIRETHVDTLKSTSNFIYSFYIYVLIIRNMFDRTCANYMFFV